MAKEALFSKLNLKDYNKELEDLLEKKDISSDVKNLLLSVLYKMETSYHDYKEIKRDIPSKKEMVEQIIQKIGACDQICLVKPQSEESKPLEEKKIDFLADKKLNQITCYLNEKTLLTAILKMNQSEIKIYDKYDLIKNSMIQMLQSGSEMDTIEIIRDFNGWAWSTIQSEFENTWYNIIYQNLKILLGADFLQRWISSKDSIIDYIENMQNSLEEKYTKEVSEVFIKQLYKVVVKIQAQSYEEEKEKIMVRKEELESQREKWENKAIFLEEVSHKKKEALKQINRLDDRMNNKKLLEQELIKKNKDLSEEEQIFSISHLKEVLAKQRQEIFTQIQEYGKMMDPKKYTAKKEKWQEEINFIDSLNLGQKEKILPEFLSLQEAFLECLAKKIEKVEVKKEQNKKEIIDQIYFLRYYGLLLLENGERIKDQNRLIPKIEALQKKVINKATESKVTTFISTQKDVNYEIIKPIFELKLIELTNVQLKLLTNEGKKTEEKDKENKQKQYELEIYDGETLETKIDLTLENIGKKTSLKVNKPVKLFS